jgi:hypothetical protein
VALFLLLLGPAAAQSLPTGDGAPKQNQPSEIVELQAAFAAPASGFAQENNARSLIRVPQKAAPPAEAAARGRIQELYGQLPLSFEANQGQSDGRVRFTSRGQGYALFLTETEAVLSLRTSDRQTRHRRSPLEPVSLQHQRGGSTSAILRIRLEHANPTPRLNGVDELVGKSNYFIGNERSRWISNIPTYGRVKCSGVYPDIDLVYHSSQRQLEYDFVLAPGSDPDRIEPRFAGAKRLRVDRVGNLVVRMAGGQVIEHAPVIYQEIGGRRRPVAGGYVLKSKDKVGFKLASYDRHNPVTIDPSLAYSTYVGGSNEDDGNGVAVDASGNAYVTGITTSSDFPTTVGALQTNLGGHRVAFVSKLDSTGSALVYSTYLGGSNSDSGVGVAVDPSGNAYVTGITRSNDFLTTAGALQTSLGGSQDAFVSKLNSTGSALAYSTYLGGSGFDGGSGVAVDASGDAYVTGFTGSVDFPTTAGALQTTFGGIQVAFVSKLNSTGSALVYSTYLRGRMVAMDASPFGSGTGVAVDSSGNAYVTGSTGFSDFPTTAGALQTTFGGDGADAFVSTLNSTGSALVYSTYLGGSNLDRGLGVAVDSSGNAYVTGSTFSSDFPTTAGAPQTTFGGSGDAFVSKISTVNTLNNFVSFVPVPSSFTTESPAVCPSGFVGTFNFFATLTNTTSATPLSNLVVRVAELSQGNRLQNADGGPGGVGARLSPPRADGYVNGSLPLNAFVDVAFVICLKTTATFSFFVDVLGTM